MTSQNDTNGVVSPTVSLIYKPASQLTAYATFAKSVEQGEQAPTGDSQRQSVSCAISRPGIRGRPQIRDHAATSRHLRSISDDAPARGDRSGLEHLRGGGHSTQQRRRA